MFGPHPRRSVTVPNRVPTLVGQRVLLVITGGIAAYKSLDLVRRGELSNGDVMTVLERTSIERDTFAVAELWSIVDAYRLTAYWGFSAQA